ncbi:UDP-glycosyltransferase 85A2 [Glycine soja]|uniref:UDP-glycosyltransferase 85A2 n=1 Tax=Glycine soja TaxID=3848 RepID=A0A0B2QHV1_GLYSO|nr:UDP-glycosyltransferase 85A2 [Glycine soja]
MTSDQLIEFARGLANSGKTFLWVIRPDLVDGENMVLPYELCQRLKIEEWGAGMQIEGDVTRDRVERFVRELMEGQKGEELTKKALEWKKLAEDATIHKDGSSFLNYHNMFRQVLLSDNNRNQLKTSSVWGLDFI